MARVSMRTVANKSGVTYSATSTTIPYAEDYEVIKDAIQDAAAGINTEQIEIGGTEAVTKSGNALIFGDTVSGNYMKFDTVSNKVELYVNSQKVSEWS